MSAAVASAAAMIAPTRSLAAAAVDGAAAARARSASDVCSSSTPSAMLVRPRLRARSMIDRTMTASLASAVMCITNERSILIACARRRLR